MTRTEYGEVYQVPCNEAGSQWLNFIEPRPSATPYDTVKPHISSKPMETWKHRRQKLKAPVETLVKPCSPSIKRPAEAEPAEVEEEEEEEVEEVEEAARAETLLKA